MQRSNTPCHRFWLIFMALSLTLAQADAFAKRPWSGPDDKPGKKDSRDTGRNKAPTISGTPETSVEVEQYYAFQAQASDPDGDPLTFSIANKPAWAAFDSASGFLSGYPADINAGSVTEGVVISVSDGTHTVSLPAFSLSVTGAEADNTPPVISGTPDDEVVAEQRYDWLPGASDADGDPLEFSVTRLPQWANFDPGTGRIHGTPVAADVGLYENINVSVTDGLATASTGEFSVAVVETTNGAATLSWQPPTENTDGSPLTGLAGYRIHYGKTTGSYDHEIEIDDPGVTSATVQNLSPGAWYFAATAVNSAGVQSDFSDEVAKTIQ